MGGHFPDNKQTLLLKSALSERSIAIRYFVSWLEINNLDRLNPASKTFLTDFMDSIDAGSHRILPLLVHNLGEDTHPYFKFLTGTRKNYWVKNKQIANTTAQIQKILEEHAIPGMRIKGHDIAECYYENIGHRPMNNGNILIPYQFRRQAIELVRRGIFGNIAVNYGYEPKEMAHTMHLEFEGKIGVQLHWSIFREYANRPESSDFIWADAIKDTKAGYSNYRMSATHALFVSIVHGRYFEQTPPFRWVADAKMILKNSDIDWDKFLELVQIFHYKPFLKKAINYLKEHHNPEIPNDFVEKLNKLEVSEPEDKYYLAISKNNSKYGSGSLRWHGINKRVYQHTLFLKNAGIPLSGYLFSLIYNRIRAYLIK